MLKANALLKYISIESFLRLAIAFAASYASCFLLFLSAMSSSLLPFYYYAPHVAGIYILAIALWARHAISLAIAITFFATIGLAYLCIALVGFDAIRSVAASITGVLDAGQLRVTYASLGALSIFLACYYYRRRAIYPALNKTKRVLISNAILCAAMSAYGASVYVVKDANVAIAYPNYQYYIDLLTEKGISISSGSRLKIVHKAIFVHHRARPKHLLFDKDSKSVVSQR